MKIPKATARFSVVVERCGRPEPVTLWVSPKKDPHFQAAVEKNRVMSVKQETAGSKKDFGVVGFHREPNMAYWIFPKPLTAFEGKRIVGIDYSLLKTPKVESGAAGFVPKVFRPPKQAGNRGGGSEPRSETAHEPSAPPPNVLTRYRVRLRCVSEVELSREVEAGSKRQAQEEALATVQTEAVDFASGKITWKALKTEKLAGPIQNS